MFNSNKNRIVKYYFTHSTPAKMDLSASWPFGDRIFFTTNQFPIWPPIPIVSLRISLPVIVV